MILIHLSFNGKSALIDPSIIVFAEEMEGRDKDEKKINFTRLYLKQSISEDGENNIQQVDIQESIDRLTKLLR